MPSLTDILWIGVATASGLLSAIHFETWRARRSEKIQLMLAAMGLLVLCSAFVELAALHAATPAEYAVAFRWGTALTLPMVVAVVWVVSSVVPGRLPLAVTVVVLRALATVANFTSGVGLWFSEITGLRQVVMPWGEVVAGPIGISNPWVVLGVASNLLLLVYLADATVRQARRKPAVDRARKLRIVGGMFAFALLSLVINNAVILLGAPLPVMVAPYYLLMMMVVGRELSREMARAGELDDALRLSESNLHEIQRDIDLAEKVGGLAVWTWASGSDEIGLSDAGRALAGLPPGAHASLRTECTRIAPEDVPRLRHLVQRVIDGDTEELRTELRFTLPGGEPRWIALFGRALRSADGGFRQLHGVAFDLTAQRDLDEQFKVVVGASPAAMLLVADDGHILMANGAALALTGYSANELLGRTIETLVPSESRAGHPADRRAYSSDASPRRMSPRRDVMLERKDGRRVPVEVALNAVTLRNKAFVVAAVIDLSERLEKDREIANQRGMLAHLSRVGMLSELSGSLAHEINQPLTAILSNAQASVRYLDRPQPDLAEVKEGLVQVIESAKRAGEVIRRLRAMLRKDPPEMLPLDANAVVADVMRIVRSDLIERGVVFHLQLEQGLPMVNGDQVQLQQVLINLINNACEAMVAQAPEKRIRIVSAKAEGGVVLQVVDSGHGIPEHDLAKVFEPFVSTKATGLGFGLALCTSLVQAQGGRIWATNNADGGATFHVFLAQREADAPSPASAPR